MERDIAGSEEVPADREIGNKDENTGNVEGSGWYLRHAGELKPFTIGPEKRDNRGTRLCRRGKSRTSGSDNLEPTNTNNRLKGVDKYNSSLRILIVAWLKSYE